MACERGLKKPMNNYLEGRCINTSKDAAWLI